MNKNSHRSDFNGKRALNNFWTIWNYNHKPVKQIDWCMYFLRTVQWKGRSSGIFDKPVVFVGVQESYWPWCSAYHHQKNTACPGKKGKEKNSQTAKVKTSVLMYVIYPKYSLECSKKKTVKRQGWVWGFFFIALSTESWIDNWLSWQNLEERT